MAESRDATKLQVGLATVGSLLLAAGSAGYSWSRVDDAVGNQKEQSQSIDSLRNITSSHSSRMDAMKREQELIEQARDRERAEMNRRLERIEQKLDRLVDRDR